MQRNVLFPTPEIDIDPSALADSVSTMKAVLAAKKFRLWSKGKNFNCYVFASLNELRHFIDWLDSVKKTAPTGTRFQYVLEHSWHWSAADIRVKDGGLEFFLLDSLHSQNIFVNTIETIKARSSDALITVSSGMPLQRDQKNCGIFAFDFACQMAKISDLHEQISAFTQPIPRTDRLGRALYHCKNVGIVRKIDINDFPPALGPLLRNVQDVPSDSIWFKRGHFANKHVSLKDYIMRNGHAQKTVDDTLSSDAVSQKKIKLQTKTIFFHLTRQAEIEREQRDIVPAKCRL